MEFVEAPAFAAHVAAYLEDDEYRALQVFLAADPQAGAVIPGTGGFRRALKSALEAELARRSVRRAFRRT